MSDDRVGARVRIEVVEILEGGECSTGIAVGDSWTVSNEQVPPSMCAWAFNSLMPFLQTLRFGGSFPWEAEPDTALVCCPDPANPVVFKLTVLPD